jgi:hypothetical protein
VLVLIVAERLAASLASHIVCTRSTAARTGSSIGEAVSIRLRPMSRSVPAISAWRPAAVSNGLSFTLRPGKPVSAATGRSIASMIDSRSSMSSRTYRGGWINKLSTDDD